MVRTQISLEPDLYREARKEAERRGISFAELCRRALLGELPRATSEAPWMRYSGAIDADVPDASTSVDEVVYDREHP